MTDKKPRTNNAIVIHPHLRKEKRSRTPDDELLEAAGLTAAIGLTAAHALVIKVNEARPATLIGGGQVDEIKKLAEECHAVLIVINHALTPVQQRNLEEQTACKVIDRTGLILEIFGERAHTKEGQLQVEQAALTYQRSRLVRSWTHLERQRGGFGFLGGPGETQLEMDRRLIDDRIERIKLDLADVRRMRDIQRKQRERREMPVVALVGYTNAGKSTLFNRLTAASVMAENMLFATLDPTMRSVMLPSNRTIVLSDTVGFISDLPTHLVESFRATLEEVERADVILHVRDAAHKDTLAQKHDVLDVLKTLGIADDDKRLIEVLNKTDLLDEHEQIMLRSGSASMPANKRKLIPVSAVTGEGVDMLLATLDAVAFGEVIEKTFLLPPTAGQMLAWLYANGRVLERHDDEAGCHVTAALSKADMARFEKIYNG